MIIKIKYFDPTLPKIEKIEIGDWIDLRCAKDTMIDQGSSACIPLGVAMQLPDGFEAHVLPRSSTFKHYGIIQTNGMGIVDESYNGNNDQWYMPVFATRYIKINKGERICQFRITEKMPKVKLLEVEVLENEDRGGYGSTGNS